MPTTDQRFAVNYVGTKVSSSGVTTVMSSAVPRAVGFYKTISALNPGCFLPGEYRCNNVTIQTFFAVARDVVFPATQAGTYVYEASGTIGGLLATNYNLAGLLPAAAALVTPWSESKAQEVLNRALANVANPDLDVGTMLGELPETLSGLRNPLSALRKAMKDFKLWQLRYEAAILEKPPEKVRDSVKQRLKRQRHRARMRQSKASVDGLSGSLLEYRYGIAPLIRSVQDIITYVNTAIQQWHGKLRQRRSRSNPVRLTEVFDRSTTVGVWTCGTSFRKEVVDQYSASVSYKCKRPPSVDEVLGFSFLDLPGIAWELTTLSFVFDWFVSVGKWLGAVKSLLSSRFEIAGCSVSRKTTISLQGWITSVTVYGQRVNYSSPGTEFECTSATLTRKCYPKPGVFDVMPRINSSSLSLFQQLDSLALTWQRLSGSVFKRRKTN